MHGRDSNQGTSLGAGRMTSHRATPHPKELRFTQTAKNATKDCILEHVDIKMLFSGGSLQVVKKITVPIRRMYMFNKQQPAQYGCVYINHAKLLEVYSRPIFTSTYLQIACCCEIIADIAWE
jgi:hypothetical protein